MTTIFAVSSGRPPAAIAVLRISGSKAGIAGKVLAGTLPIPRRAAVRALRDANGGVLDHALVLWFPGPATVTGEDLLELHLHGGRAVVAAVERALTTLSGLRPAMAGEFTRRALTAGRIDLAQAQGLADLLEAETETQRRAAIATVDGALSAALAGLLDRLSDIAAGLEAAIDFDDEDDVASADFTALRSDIAHWCDDVDALVARPTVERLRDGIRIVLAGPPNAGKSSLFNALVDREAAIVTAIAGTTRDSIEQTIVRRGAAYTLIDTAGLADQTDDPIEAIGIARARIAAETADLVLWLGDDVTGISFHRLELHARCDLPERQDVPDDKIAVSVRDPESVQYLWSAIEAATDTMLRSKDDLTLRGEQRDTLALASADLRTTQTLDDPILLAEIVRMASRRVARLLGIDATEAMLDALFGRFCIGK